jgi:UDP-glucose 4-epimerase
MTILKAAAQRQVERVIFASSREVYGEQATIPVHEEAPLNAKNLYGASKLSAESYCRAWADASGVDCVILRFANIYGPRDSGRVIPLWLQQAEEGQELVLYGGKQVLDFIWIGTAVEALVKAAHSVPNGPINVGSGQGTPLPELAERIKELVRSNSAIRVESARGPEVSRFVADVHKMREHLEITPPADSLSYLHLLMTAASDRGGAQAP